MKILGVMSGSSLDGLDIALCTFQQDNKGKFVYSIEASQTFPFTSYLKSRLENLKSLSAEDFIKLDTDFGIFIGNMINKFLKGNELSFPDLVASHGHTAFHNPLNGYSKQIGSGDHIAAITDIPSITNFRSMDVALGGEGAPLVPVGDQLLFSEYDFCLNLGGYGNISFEEKGQRKAFDICPVNKALNYVASWEGLIMDEDGKIGRTGKIIPPLYEQLNRLEFYSRKGPKSLADSWLNEKFIPVIDQYKKKSISDVLSTLYEHIGFQVHQVTKEYPKGKIFITGGGAFNTCLIEKIQNSTLHNVQIPSKEIIEFKESLIFAFLGFLKVKGEVNCLASVTGARKNSIGGTLHEI
jgi:anhydro-N-acetylmuramic acid kinase